MSSSSLFELSPPPGDAISSLNFAPDSSKLLVSSWDNHVYLYDAHAQSDAQLIRKFEHKAPVLAARFGADENVAYTAGLDRAVQRLDLTTGELTALSYHEAGINCLVYSAPHKMLISASWDKTLHIHHPESPSVTVCTLDLPAKPFALAITESKLIIAMSERLVHIYDLDKLNAVTTLDEDGPLRIEPYQRRESSLKFMTRALAVMPNGEGYASSSIEGRVAVEWLDASEESQARKYAFKCHRQPASDGSGDDVVYPVHALAFHPTYGVFVSGGGDGAVAMWDAIKKRRIRQYQRLPASVAALEFSKDGSLLAIGVSPGFEDGQDGAEAGEVKVYVRTIKESETKLKSDKS